MDCEEKHVVRPFSHEGSGATTTVKQSLTFMEHELIESEETRIKERLYRKESILNLLLFSADLWALCDPWIIHLLVERWLKLKECAGMDKPRNKDPQKESYLIQI